MKNLIDRLSRFWSWCNQLLKDAAEYHKQLEEGTWQRHFPENPRGLPKQKKE